MRAIYRGCFRPLLFRLDPERAHALALRALAFLPERTPLTSPGLRVRIADLSFPNPIGLAAGFDKEGAHAHLLARLGFGHIEVGTVTPRPQEGNPRPRLFRDVPRRALLNRMGFNNPGAAAAARELARALAAGPRPVPVGASIGKQRETDLDRAAGDYREAVSLLLPVSDFLVVNVSSPNTPGLRSLEHAERLRPLLVEIRADAERRAVEIARPRPPLLAKLSPDLDDPDLEASAAAVRDAGFDGLVLTNTTTRPDLVGPLGRGAGGLSGAPLAPRALEALRIARRATGGRLPLVGVGGIFTAEDAYARIRAGASLVQIYTALVYEGPGLVRRMLRGLEALLARDGYGSVEEAVGAE
jgi:dihydroorotate dehydrogenase